MESVTITINKHSINRTYINDRASAGGSGMLGVFQDVFLAETPVTPAEIADLVDALEIEY